jgi:hypothetical protein
MERILATIVALGILAASAWAQATAPAAITATDISGSGSWQTDGKSTAPTQRWSLDLKRGADNSVYGRVTLTGSPLASTGYVRGKIDGQLVSGTIVDDTGNHVAAFEGTVNKSGMLGKYTDRTGETGEWAWEGELPQ